MEKRSAFRTDVAALTLIGMIGAGLALAPSHLTVQLRGGIRDGLLPGHRAVLALSQWSRSAWDRFRSPTATEELARVRSELDQWQQQCLSLEARQAELMQQAIDARQGTANLFEGEPGRPLLVPQLLQAEVLGTERDMLRARLNRLLDRGTDQQIAIDDLVLADDAPHLDQGDEAGVQPDMPVLDGRCVVGRIQQVGRWTSTLQPVTDPEFRGPAQLIRESPQGPVYGTQGVIAGNGNGTCRLEHVAATEPVSVGDFVYTVRRRHSLPEPVCYGRVIAAEISDGAGHWSITVQPGGGREPLETVLVLRELPNPERFSPTEDSEAPRLQARRAAFARPLWAAGSDAATHSRF
jgi:rod shape-determining protein MreC